MDWFLSAFDSAAINQRQGYEQLKAELLESSPFKDCEHNHIWNESVAPKESSPCQDWSRLVAEIIFSLYLCCQHIPAKEEAVPQEAMRRTQLSLNHLDLMWKYVLDLKKRRGLSTSARKKIKHIHRSAITQALTILRTVAESPTLEDYRFMKRLFPTSIDRRLLATLMDDCFSQFGPVGSSFPPKAKDEAIAAILIHFGVEQGTRATVVARLRQRATRASPPAPKDPIPGDDVSH
jgi:hypothetical protein